MSYLIAAALVAMLALYGSAIAVNIRLLHQTRAQRRRITNQRKEIDALTSRVHRADAKASEAEGRRRANAEAKAWKRLLIQDLGEEAANELFKRHGLEDV